MEINFLNDILPFIVGGIIGYKYPVKRLMKNPFWCGLQFFMALIWFWLITIPIRYVIFMFGAK